MTDRRKKNINWYVADEDGVTRSTEAAHLAVLMDVRDELKRLNALLHCHNAVEVPNILRTIAANTKPKRRKAQRGAR